MKKLLILTLFLLLSACNNNTLEPPANLRYEEDQIKWDRVENATYYTIKINDETDDTITTFYSTADLENGTYSVSVQANNNDTASSFTADLEITINKTTTIPTGLTIEGETLFWDDIELASSYIVEINEEDYTAADNSYDLSLLGTNAIYTIRVKAIYTNNESSFSEVIQYHTLLLADETYQIIYDLNDPTPPNTTLDTEIDIAFIYLNNSYTTDPILELEGTQMQVSDSFIESVSIGVYDFIIITTDNRRIDLQFVMKEGEEPYIISPSRVVYVNDDIEFEFELFDGEITSVSGLDITNTDYTIDNTILTIHSEFIEDLIQAEPDRDTIILVYQLQSSSEITIGYLFIEIK